MIGIFWVYKHHVFGAPCSVSEGESTTIGMTDSQATHAATWDRLRSIRTKFPELSFLEYFEVPRGRVVFDQKSSQFIVYIDNVLNTPEIRRIISDFFKLHAHSVIWRRDPHYTTTTENIDQLFDEGG